jgi:hypothetical protein
MPSKKKSKARKGGKKMKEEGQQQSKPLSSKHRANK